MPDFASLPINDVLEEISRKLKSENKLVLAAPPGAGKTTCVPLHLLSSDWLEGQKVILVEPRRIAARRAAERMAEMLGEKVGQTIGLRSRLDTRIGPGTRIEVVTDGVFSNQIIREPDLPGTGAVLFDEFHERALEADLGLTLALETQSVLRDDLRLLIMSATLDTARVSNFLQAGVIESHGRAYPVDTRYLGRSEDRLEDQMARAIRKALAEEVGSILAFLPGAAEINRTADALGRLAPHIHICQLYGALSPRDQDEAIRPAPEGERKIVLATDIAESSLTIEGVRVVVDAGLARVPGYKPGQSGSVLITRKASVANIDQRRGRAGRTEPGICYRLWHEEENRGLATAPEPEINATDLSALILRLGLWGDTDPFRLNWLDAPKAGHVSGAKAELVALGFLNTTDELTGKGRRAASLPLTPRLSALIIAGDTPEERRLGAEIAAILSERGIGGNSDEVADRVRSFESARDGRTETLKKQSLKWSGEGQGKVSKDIDALLAKAWPDRIARVRPSDPERYQSVGGQGYRLPKASRFLGKPWLIVVESGGAHSGDQIIRLATVIDEALARKSVEPTIHVRSEFDPVALTLKGREVRGLGEITLSERPLQKLSKDQMAEAVKAYVQESGFEKLESWSVIQAFLARLDLARRFSSVAETLPDLSPERLAAACDDWLGPAISSNGLSALHPENMTQHLFSLLDWQVKTEIEALVPPYWQIPGVRKVRIEYLGDQAPMISARAQEFYGLKAHPTIAGGRCPLTISLLSPAQRQIALTKDLPGFWAGGYLDMRKDMRGRYPKHDWPEDPANGTPLKPSR